MKSAYELLLVAIEALAFCVAVFSFFSGLTSFTEFEDKVNKEIDNKINITVTDNMYDDETITYIEGSIVFQEVMALMQDNVNGTRESSVKLVVDGNVLNDIISPVTGEDIFEIMQNGGNAAELISSKINFDKVYKKVHSVDKNSNLTKVVYK